MDREAWKVTVHRVAKSQTRLKWFSTVQTFVSFQVYKSTHQIMPTVEFSLKSAKYPESSFFFFFFPWECTGFEESRTGKLLLSCTRGKWSKYQHDPPSVCYAIIKRVLCLRARSLTLTILTGNKNIYIWEYINTCYFNRYILIKYFFEWRLFQLTYIFEWWSNSWRKTTWVKRSNLCTRWIDLSLSATLYGEGNGTPLQYFCLENSMDGWAW